MNIIDNKVTSVFLYAWNRSCRSSISINSAHLSDCLLALGLDRVGLMINDGSLKLMIPGCWKWLGGKGVCADDLYNRCLSWHGEITW